MSNLLGDGMAEAMRLTREGRLNEATALIQRALGGGLAPETASGETGETTQRASDGDQGNSIPTLPDGGGRGLRPAPKPPRQFRGMQDLPAGLSGGLPSGLSVAMPGMAGASAPEVVVPDGARFVERSFANDAGGRGYKLYVPGGYVGQGVPLVVMLHGCTQNPDDFATGTHMNGLAEEHTFLVAYPAQAANANMQGCWNWFKAGDQVRGRGEPSIIAGIACEVLGEYNVDPDRVYLAGMSAGGAMAAVVAEAYPDLFAAVGVHSGLAPGAARDMSSAFSAMQGGGAASAHASTSAAGPRVPAIVFHGDRDTTVNPRNADQLVAFYRAGAPEKPARPATVRQGQAPGGHNYTRIVHHGADGVAAEQWTVHGLGHCWSGGSRPGSYTDPNGPDASAEMLRFFRENRRREPAL